MLDINNHNNSSCAFGEQIVSYLYGETTVKEKTIFETHLNSCTDCAEELAGFTMARSSVIDWRNEEFLSLETPLIRIPYEKTQEFYIAETDSTKISHNWLNEIRRIFSLSPVLTASASFALVLLCFGIMFFAGKSSNNGDVAGIGGKNTEQLTSLPTASNEKSGNDVKNNDVSNVEFEKTIGAASTSKDVKETRPLTAAAENNNLKTISNLKIARKNLSIKISDVSESSGKNLNPETRPSKVKAVSDANKKPMFAQTEKIPTLNNVEEDEDKSLRLAELFDDGDAR